MSDELPRIPAEAKEIIKHKKTGQVYESKAAFDADVAGGNCRLLVTTNSNQQTIKVTRMTTVV